MSPEACQGLSWHRAVAETDETPFWPACSQSDGPAQGERKDNREKSRPPLLRLDQMPDVSPGPVGIIPSTSGRGTRPGARCTMQKKCKTVVLMREHNGGCAGHAVLSGGVCGEVGYGIYVSDENSR